MSKLDLKKVEREQYSAPRDHAEIVDVPEESFFMVDGKGSPYETASFQEAIGALYAASFALKFDLKKRDPELDQVVMPVEALWWWDGDKPLLETPQKDWNWTLMIRQPDHASERDAARAIAAATKKGTASIEKVRFAKFREGRSMQIMHQGPYNAEMPTIEHLHDDIRKNGYVANGKHHEIYLGDPRRAKPEKLKTIVRQPVRWTDEGQE